MKRIAVVVLIVLCGCHHEPAHNSVVLHPAGEAKADCHPEKEKVAEIKEVVSIQPWWMNHAPDCPEDMRLVMPSIREVEAGYKKFDDSSYNNDEGMNWKYRHATCIPDSLTK
jgi:hypothetical protein